MSGSGNERNSREIRLRVSNALHNMVHAHPMDKQRKREAKVLRLIESLRCYADLLRDVKEAVESETGGATRPDLAAVLCHGCRPISVKLPPPSTAQSSPSAVESVLVICGKTKGQIPLLCLACRLCCTVHTVTTQFSSTCGRSACLRGGETRVT